MTTQKAKTLAEWICKRGGTRIYEKHPYYYNGEIISTDSSIIIRFKSDNLGFEQATDDLASKLLKPFDYPETCSRRILVSQIKNSVLDGITPNKQTAKIGRDAECIECDGEGEVGWVYKRYTESFDCPKCNGSGIESYGETKETGLLIYDNEYKAVKFMTDAIFSSLYIGILVQIAELLGEEYIEITDNGEGITQSQFRIGEVRAILMPLHDFSYEVIVL